MDSANTQEVRSADEDQANYLGRALALLQKIANLTELPISVSQEIGGRALDALSQIARDPQNASRRGEYDEDLRQLLGHIDPDWLASHGALTAELQRVAWFGYFQQRAASRPQPFDDDDESMLRRIRPR